MFDMAQSNGKTCSAAGLGKFGRANLYDLVRGFLARFAIILTFLLAPAAVLAQQMCTPTSIGNANTTTQLFDGNGTERFETNPVLAPGDLVVYRDAIVADYNSGARIDIIYQVVDVDVPNGGSVELRTNNNRIEIRASQPTQDPYITFRLLTFIGGTFDPSTVTGEPADLINATVALQDIDSNGNQNFSDLGGIFQGSPSQPTSVTLTNTVSQPFLNGGGPANFDTFSAEPRPANSSPPDFTSVPNVIGNDASFSANFNFAEFNDATFVHGVTGVATNTPNRGAVLAVCGTILAPELEFEKNVLNEVENADGTTDVTYRLTLRNTGEQDLDLLSLTDEVDAIFSTPVDVFLPSTTADPSGGIFALDPASTTVVDVGPVLVPIATNSNFDGAADVEILAQPTTSVLTPGDEAFVDVTIRLFLNDSDDPVSFVNVANATVLDEFNLPIMANAPSPPVNVPSRPSRIALVKSVASVDDTNGSGAFGDAGDTVNYVFTVENTGLTSLAQIAVTDTGIPGVSAIPAFGFDGNLAVGEGPIVAATASLIIQETDLLAGTIVNTASVTSQPVATGPGGEPDPTIPLVDPNTGAPYTADAISDDSDTGTTPDLNFADGTVPDIANPAGTNGQNDPTVLTLPEPPVANPDSENGFTPGDVATLPNITTNDQDDGALQADRVSLVAPLGATTITDADGDVISVTVPGQGVWAVDNAGNVTFTPESGFEEDPTPIEYTVLDNDGFRSNAALLSVDYNQAPSIAVTKTADTSALSTPPLAGEQITYIYTVSNTGNVTLFDVTVDENPVDFTGNGTLPAPVFQSGGANIDGEADGNDLAPGSDIITFSATYLLEQADIDQGGVENSASATGGNVTGTPVTDTSDDPGVDNGNVDNGDPADPTVVPLNQESSLSLIKKVANADDANGDGAIGGVDDNITFSFTVTNTGNTTLTDVTVTDSNPLVVVSPAGGTITLEPGMGDSTTFTGTYVVTAADVAATAFQNSATADGVGPGNVAVTDVSDSGNDRDGTLVVNPEGTETPDINGNTDGITDNDPTVIRIPVNALPRLSVIKSISGVADTNSNGLIDAGDVVSYSFDVTNVGNVRLNDVVVEDTVIGFTSAPFNLGIPGQTPPAISQTVTAPYTLLASDVTRGALENTATAMGNAVDGLGNPLLDDNNVQITGFDTSDAGTEPELDSSGNPVAIVNPEGSETPDNTAGPNGDPTDDPTVLLIPSPELRVTKSISLIADTNGDGVAGGVGDILGYSFEIENTGNVDLQDVTLTDPIATLIGAPFDLAVDDVNTTAYTATIEIMATDLQDGFIENTAEATGNAVSGDGVPLFGPGGELITATDTSDTGTDPSGDEIIDPENTPSPNGAGVDDNDPTNDPTVFDILVAPVARDDSVDSQVPGTSATLLQIVNANDDDQDGIVQVDRVSLIPPQGAATVADANGDIISVTVPGEGVWNYDDVTGNATFTPEPGFDGDPTPISYTVLDDDGLISNPALLTVDYDQMPAVTLLKTVDSSALSLPPVAGEIVTYTYTVNNTGNVALQNVTVTETTFTGTGTTPVPGGEVITSNDSGLSIDAAANGSVDNLGAGDTATFTADYAITQADINAGMVDNQATVTGDNVTGTPISDLSDDPNDPTTPDGDPTTVTFGQNPTLELVKSASGVLSAPPAVGDTVTYDFVVTNTGNVTVLNVTVTDTEFSGTGTLPSPTFVSGGSDEDSGAGVQDLLPGQSIIFRSTYQITQADIVAGMLENSATTSGTDADGDLVTDVSDSGTQPNGDAIDNPGVTETGDGDGNLDGDVTNDPTVFNIDTPPTAGDDAVTGLTPGDPAVLENIVGVNDADVDGTPQQDRVSLVAPDGATTVADADGDIISVTVPGEGVWTYDDITGAATFTPEEGFENDPTAISYTVLDDDGLISNAAMLTAEYVREPGISVTKVADITELFTPPVEGDIVTFVYTVTNTGNVRLFDVTISENVADFTGTGTLPVPVLTSGGSDLNANGNAADLEAGTDTLTFEAPYALTQADIDNGEVTNQASASGDNVTGTPVTDTSDDPNNDNDAVEDGDPADPTVVTLSQAPQISVIKSVAAVPDTNGDGLFGGEGDIIFYSFFVQNTGNVTLTDIAIDDPLFDVLPVGTTISLAPSEGDTTTFTGEYEITPENFADGFVVNQASVSGIAPNGQVVTDVSDTGTDPDTQPIQDSETVETADENDVSDGDPTNDPTVQSLPVNAEPRLQVTKSVSSVQDLNSNGLVDAGDIVVFSFIVANTGNVELADIELTDNLAEVSGTLDRLPVLGVNTDAFTAEYTVQASDVQAGAIENSASVSGGAINSLGDPISDPDTGEQLTASDVSDAGTEPDLANGGTPVAINAPEFNETPDANGNTDGDFTNDPTVLSVPTPQISLVKSVSDVADTDGDGLFGGPGDIITYAFTVRNDGDIPLGDITVTDDTATVVGGPISLAAGSTDSITFTATYEVTNADLLPGFVENTALVDGIGLDASGAPLLGLGGVPITVSDVSDTGTDPTAAVIDNPEGVETGDGDSATDGDPTNDPTITLVPLNPEAELSLIKSAVGSEDTNGDAVAGGFDDLLTYEFAVTNRGNFPLANVAVTDPLLGGLVGTIALLDVGETQTVTGTYLITFADFTRGLVENSAQASGALVNSQGTPILDGVTGQPIIASDTSDTGTDRALGDIDNPEGVETTDQNDATDDDSTNDPTVTTTPTVPSGALVSGVFFQDGNGNGTFDVAVDTLVAGIVVNLLDDQGRIIGSAVTDANGFYEIAGFPVGNDFQIQFRDPATNELQDSIEGLNFGANTVLPNQDGLTEVLLPSQLILTKSTTRDTVILGDSVPYIISVTNNGAGPAQDVTITDTLPAGMGFIPGSASVSGVASTPGVTGRTQTFTNISIDPGTTVEIRLLATVLPNAPFGELTNIARAIDPVTSEVLASATATVERLPEAVFDCSDVIGKVFDDRNFNGYQDGPPRRDGRITNQNLFTGKVTPVVPATEGEPGLPNVRLVTATGTIITTDEYGRYSVPCAELAGDIGTNFTLKLDPNSLPTGYRITTENPRTMRLTAGIATEMNFGAAIGRVLDVDLTSDAFDQTQPSERLESGLVRLLTQIRDTPSVVRISYFTRGEPAENARARVKEVEALIERHWRDVGRYGLIVETTIKRLQ